MELWSGFFFYCLFHRYLRTELLQCLFFKPQDWTYSVSRSCLALEPRVDRPLSARCRSLTPVVQNAAPELKKKPRSNVLPSGKRKEQRERERGGRSREEILSWSGWNCHVIMYSAPWLHSCQTFTVFLYESFSSVMSLTHWGHRDSWKEWCYDVKAEVPTHTHLIKLQFPLYDGRTGSI